jgi:hypothetical protein
MTRPKRSCCKARVASSNACFDIEKLKMLATTPRVIKITLGTKQEKIEKTLTEICKGGSVPKQVHADIQKIKQLDAEIAGSYCY